MKWKYKVGDLVVVKDSCQAGHLIGEVIFVKNMNKYKGKVCVVKECVSCGEDGIPAYHLDPNPYPDDPYEYFFTNEMLETVSIINRNDLLDFISGE